jgi:hypothetical protein
MFDLSNARVHEARAGALLALPSARWIGHSQPTDPFR